MTKSNIKYDSLIPSESYLQTSSELVSGKAEDIHQQAYDIALSNWLQDHKEYKEGHTITEIRKKDFTEAPSILVTSSKYPFKKKTFSLKEYWKEITFSKRKENQWKEMQVDEEGIEDAQIVHIDYVRGKVKMESKMTGNEIEVGLDAINAYTPVDDDKMGLTNTFTYLSK